MKVKIRLASFTLAISLLFVSFSGFSSSNEATETIDKVRDTKILCTATVDQEFDDSSVLVIMDNISGGINKQHDLSFFGDIGASSITDLTTLSSDTLVSSGIVSSESVSRGMSETATISTKKLPWFEVNVETFRQILKIELSTHSKENVLNVIKKLEKIEGIKYAGPNYKMRLCSDDIDLTRSSKDEEEVNQYPWGIIKTNVEGAWNIAPGSHNIKVGVIDSGIAQHPNLLDNLVAGKNFFNNSSTGDTYGHGTGVAGVIGAVAGNGLDVQGVCQNVSLVPLKVYTTKDENGYTNGNSDDVAYAIDYATDNGIHIINCSMEIRADDSAVAQAIINYPGLFVTAAGNDDSDNDGTPQYPSDYTKTLTNVISVGASYFMKVTQDTDVDTIYVSSNFGANSVDLFAPGYDFKSTWINDEGQKEVSGTSYAAPFVSGAAALIMSVRPDLSPAEVKKCIMDSVDKSNAFAGKCVSGGRLNVYKAVRLATQPQTFTGDVNGDGKADMIITRRASNGKRAIDVYLARGSGLFEEPITREFTQAYNYEDPVFVGDVNNDQKTDLIVHTTFDGDRAFLIYCGKEDGTFKNASLTVTEDSHNYFTTKAKFFVADANGDGKDDFIVHTKNSSGKRVNLTYLGEVYGSVTTFSTSASTFTSTNNYAVDPVFIGYFNNDEFPDMVVPHANSSGKRCLLVYKGQASAPYFAAGVKFNSTRNHDPVTYACQQFISDVNGDGYDDLVVHWKSANGKRNNLVYKGSSSGLTTEAVATDETSNNYIAKDPVFVGDINGDGRGDMVVQWANSGGQRNFLIYKGKEDAKYMTGANYNMSDPLDVIETPSCFLLADVTGEGRADFIVKYCDSNENVAFITYTGTGATLFNPGASTTLTNTIPYFNHTPTTQ
ncbi:MAG: S8 family serine peptidase [Clostridia bacterium]|nr:S8 family serine peptidase [Clostridia bacterium]